MSPPVLHGEVLPSKSTLGTAPVSGVRGADLEGLTFEDMRDTCPSTPYIGRGRWAAVKAWVARVWGGIRG